MLMLAIIVFFHYLCIQIPTRAYILLYYYMKKYCFDLTVKAVERPTSQHVLLVLTDDKPLPEMVPGQFVEVRVDGSDTTFLRRPISINYVDYDANELHLLVHVVGEGTARLAQLKAGDKLNCVFPLGNGFTLPSSTDEKILLVGGGVGVAPLLYLGKKIKESGATPIFLLGAKTKSDLLQLDKFAKVGTVYVTTEDGSMGEVGFVTNHSVLQREEFSRVQVCGPKPMMVAVARYAKANNVVCEVSLENMMACGLGACLCCVEKTVEGNLCVCKDGPVFNIEKLLWQI